MGNFSRAHTWSEAQLVILRATLFRWIEGWRVLLCDYTRCLAFAYTDILLWFYYCLRSPYYDARAFSVENIYGETPLSTLDRIAHACHLTSQDIVYEIGCGRGRAAFWLHHFVHCRVVGVDHVPRFIRRAQRIARWRGIDRVRFVCQDFRTLSLDNATCLYFYGTACEDAFIHTFLPQLRTLRPGTQIVTTSYSLTEYDPRFEVTSQFTGHFPWGSTTLYIHRCLAIEVRGGLMTHLQELSQDA